ncbi:MAG: hypothetical protein IPM58_13515 [Nitrospira sp.]|nr:hypothetical protein [Nitrospira sp.]
MGDGAGSIFLIAVLARRTFMPLPISMCHFATRLFLVCYWFVWVQPTAVSATTRNEAGSGERMWARLIEDAERFQLPTKFLKALPADFIQMEFDDLRTYAAEYYPGEHRMVLDRSLSFNAAGRGLKPLSKMTPKQLEVLYHELFHAYLDYLVVIDAQPDSVDRRSDELLQVARTQQVCRYGEVQITPIVQRKDETESRYLTQGESWEALNETWAVFIGWAVWNQLEVQRETEQSMFQGERQGGRWIQRFKTAFESGEFRGYYVPEDPDEQRLAQKRYLAQQSQLGLDEAVVLMDQVLGFKRNFIDRLMALVGSSEASPCSTVEGKQDKKTGAEFSS